MNPKAASGENPQNGFAERAAEICLFSSLFRAEPGSGAIQLTGCYRVLFCRATRQISSPAPCYSRVSRTRNLKWGIKPKRVSFRLSARLVCRPIPSDIDYESSPPVSKPLPYEARNNTRGDASGTSE